MRILLIKPKHIGDSLVLTPTVVALKRAHPDAEIWAVVRHNCTGILAGCPEIDRLLTVAAVDPQERRWRDLGTELATMWRLSPLAQPRFDFVFELGDGQRARRLAALTCQQPRYSVKPSETRDEPAVRRAGLIPSRFDWKRRHRVEKDFYTVSEFLPLPEPIPPLRFDRVATRPWEPAEGLRDFVVMQIGKRQSAGRWSREGWEEVGRWLLQHAGPLVISSGAAPHETEDALWLCDRLGPGARATLGRADWPQMAGLLYRARLYVGPDTATTHLAAACGCPIVALFGWTWEGHWGPWQAPHRIVTELDAPPTGDPVQDLETASHRTMAGITPAKVIAACEEMLNLKGNSPLSSS
jgi:heptosyltransferase-3